MSKCVVFTKLLSFPIHWVTTGIHFRNVSFNSFDNIITPLPFHFHVSNNSNINSLLITLIILRLIVLRSSNYYDYTKLNGTNYHPRMVYEIIETYERMSLY